MTVFTVVAVTAAVVIVRSHHEPTPPPGFARRITVRGQAMTFVGTRAWSDAVLDDRRPASVYVFAGNNGVDHTCSVTSVAHVVRRDSAPVRVLVGLYGHLIGRNEGCEASAAYLVKLRVDLDARLGTRRLLDAAAHDTARRVLDPATIPTIHRLPARYAETDVGRDSNGGARYREFADPWHNGLTLTIDRANSASRPTRLPVSVGIHPASIYWSKGFEQDLELFWRAGTHDYEVDQTSIYDRRHPPLTVAQLIAVADSVS